MSYYADYLKENYKYETIEDEYGFYVYELTEDSVHFHHVYLDPKYRKTEKAQKRMKDFYNLAKEYNKKNLTMAVDLKSTNSEENLLRYLKGGAVIYNSGPSFVSLLLRVEDIMI
tara:strand:+ start:168 stop:509 length:342 start_codon:yes stop_codon:yes gene_type:complete